ncbi:MAG: hypothetical protein IPN08_16105 [Bacteroidales bacterium]|nr:hypothetical protein [Bacteroidales bacterium]
MKKNVLLLAFILFNGLVSQGCLPGGYSLASQQQVDEFQFLFPGCTVIEGNLTISNNPMAGDPITNLNGISVLTEINGDVFIIDTWLPDLTGLNTLSRIGGSLCLWSNSYLTSLNGLENLNSIGNNLEIGTFNRGNELISDISALNHLSSLGGNLEISDSPNLASLAGLEQITSIQACSILSIHLC